MEEDNNEVRMANLFIFPFDLKNKSDFQVIFIR